MMNTQMKKHHINVFWQCCHSDGIKLIEYFPNYEKYGKGAPLERNKLIMDECDCVLAFWDGQSRGTKSMIGLAKRKGLQVAVVRFDL